MTTALEDAVRRHVADGCGLAPSHVIPGNSKGPRPKEAYASLLLMEDFRKGYPNLRQQTEDQGDDTASMVYRRAVYSLQFYRDGAAENARDFDMWASSENGLTQAETAFSDGKIKRIDVLDGGSDYDPDDPPAVTFTGGGGSGATAEVSIVAGAVAGVIVTARGSGYYDSPTVGFSGGSGSGAEATARGFGFRIDFPLRIVRLDEVIGDAWEERCVVELRVDYASVLYQDTYPVETVECEVISGGSTLSEVRTVGE